MITRYLVSYDIADPERLRKVHAVVKTSAHRVQYSVYEALMTERERVLLEERLKQVINQKEDQVIFLDLGSAARRSCRRSRRWGGCTGRRPGGRWCCRGAGCERREGA